MTYCLFSHGIVCEAKKEENRNVQQMKALHSFEKVANERNDERILELLKNVELPFLVDYTKPDQIKTFLKRQRDCQVDKSNDQVLLSPPPMLRSTVSEYDEKLNCLFCTEKIEFDQSKLAN